MNLLPSRINCSQLPGNSNIKNPCLTNNTCQYPLCRAVVTHLERTAVRITVSRLNFLPIIHLNCASKSSWNPFKLFLNGSVRLEMAVPIPPHPSPPIMYPQRMRMSTTNIAQESQATVQDPLRIWLLTWPLTQSRYDRECRFEKESEAKRNNPLD